MSARACRACRKPHATQFHDGTPCPVCTQCQFYGVSPWPVYVGEDSDLEPARVTRENYWLAGVNDLSREPKV